MMLLIQVGLNIDVLNYRELFRPCTVLAPVILKCFWLWNRCEDEREQALFHLQTLTTVEFTCFTNAYAKSSMLYQAMKYHGSSFGSIIDILFCFTSGADFPLPQVRDRPLLGHRPPPRHRIARGNDAHTGESNEDIPIHKRAMINYDFEKRTCSGTISQVVRISIRVLTSGFSCLCDCTRDRHYYRRVRVRAVQRFLLSNG